MAQGNSVVRSKIKKAQRLALSGDADSALALLANVCKKDKRNADALFSMGAILANKGDLQGAADVLTRAVECQPDHSLSWYRLGQVQEQLGTSNEAAASFAKAYRLEPAKNEILWALAQSQINAGHYKRAAESYHLLLSGDPGNRKLIIRLGECLYLARDYGGAESALRKAIEISPDADVLAKLGSTLSQQGRCDEAIELERKAAYWSGGNPKHHSNLLLSLNYQPGISEQQLFGEHVEWARRHCKGRVGTSAVALTPGRRLRIGYLSPDFRTHSVAYFILSILEHHDHSEFEVYCYSCAPFRDEVTEYIEKLSEHWREVATLGDSAASKLIASDEIDILVDLAGHTAGNRLGIFCAQPAPVQITYLGYPATTGLETIHYRLTDAIADPSGQEKFFTERLWRLPNCFLCYRPPDGAPEIVSAAQKDIITFGSFNNLAKINPKVVSVWCDILRRVPESQILIKNPSLNDESTRLRYLGLFQKQGISGDRVGLLGLAPSTYEHLATYSRIDIALDTFPYNGTTTTFEALYMGIPVISLSGRRHASRVGASILDNIGLSNLVATSESEYVQIARSLANDRAALTAMRGTLRGTLLSSRLCDGRSFVLDLEDAYRSVWKSRVRCTESP